MDDQQQQQIELEDATPDSELSADARHRKEGRLRKREARAKEKQQKQAAIDATKAMTREEFWEANRRKAGITPDQLHAMMERQTALLDLCMTMRDYMEGKLEVLDDEDRGWLAETIAQVQAEVQQHGMVTVEVALVPFHTHDEKSFFNAVVQRGGTAAFIQFGILTALPSHTVHDWEQWLQSRNTKPKAFAEESVMLRCESPVCSDPGQTVTKSYVDRLRDLKMKHFCHNCLNAERRSAAQSNISVFTQTRKDRVETFDKWGRRLDQ